MNSGTEKRLLETKVLDWSLCTHKQQLCSTAYAHAKGRKESGSDRRSGGDITVWGWMVVYGLVSVGVLTYILKKKERENQSDRQGHSFHASFTPNNNAPNEAVDACVKV